jgi:hypothetical protein
MNIPTTILIMNITTNTIMTAIITMRTAIPVTTDTDTPTA